MPEAPKDGTSIWGLYEDGAEVLILWADKRKCILTSISGGNKSFGSGWEDDLNHLVMDEPMKWRPE